jgi:hypothetical protein
VNFIPSKDFQIRRYLHSENQIRNPFARKRLQKSVSPLKILTILKEMTIDFQDGSDIFGDVYENESGEEHDDSPKPANLLPLVENDESEDESHSPLIQNINKTIKLFNCDQEHERDSGEFLIKSNQSIIRRDTKRKMSEKVVNQKDPKYSNMNLKADAHRNDQFFEASHKNTMRSNSFIFTQKQIQDYAIRENTERNIVEKYSPPYITYFDTMKTFISYFPHNNSDKIIKKIQKRERDRKMEALQRRKSRMDIMIKQNENLT